jgi:type II restriction/modification system DNA methylase subunit YeeA
MTDTKKEYNIDFERVVELISKYKQIKKSGAIKNYKEEETKKDFIVPLFEALGWNVSGRGETNDSISAEEAISKKRVDYGFRINGIPAFFLEAKSLKEENVYTNSKYVTQAIDYAWMKSCSWAILTNFETLAVFNADWKTSNYGSSVFFVLHPDDFLSDSRFEYLSKKAFENGELDKIASKYGRKQVKNPISKQLLQDMIHFRDILSKDILRNNQDKNLSQDELDESVQRILDRLIFIRNAEDRTLEENQLLSNARQWHAKGKGHLVKEISKTYKYYDDNYNSKLFAHHLCDDLYIDNEALKEVIEGLNEAKDNSYRYDFSLIESDVLGNIYEQYLGNILKSTPKRAKLEGSKAHRKEQGIYYTPSYIVDYIVKHTVGEYIKTHQFLIRLSNGKQNSRK